MAGEEAGEPGSEGARAFDRERTPAWRVHLDEPQRLRVAVAACRGSRLEQHGTGDDFDDRERVRVTVRIDTDDVVQLICKHPLTDLQPKRWGTRTRVGLGWKPRAAEL